VVRIGKLFRVFLSLAFAGLLVLALEGKGANPTAPKSGEADVVREPGDGLSQEELRDRLIYGPKDSPLRAKREECVRIYETRRYKKAATCWREIVDGGGADLFAIRTLAFSYYYANDFDSARHYFDYVIERIPNDLYTIKGKGLLALTTAKPEEAEVLFARATRLAPKNETWHRLYGVSLQRQGKAEEALAAYEKALKLRPKSISGLSLKGAALFRLDRYDEAMRTFDRILEIDPTSEVAWRNKGSCLIRSGNPEKAVEMFDVALKINPLSAEAWYNRGVALERMEQLDEARRHYERALRINSDYEAAQEALKLLKTRQAGGG
jgi:tetratricopeptide (TPR) repeat protein